MIRCPLPLFALCLCLTSCDQVKQLTARAKSAIQEKTGGAGAAGRASAIDARWTPLIDRTPEGILFRRDLPFPQEVAVTIQEREPLTARLTLSSEIGKQNTGIASIHTLSFDAARSPGSIRFSRYQEEYHDAVRKTEKNEPVVLANHPLLPPSRPKDHTFVLRNAQWSPPPNATFSDVLLAQQLGPVMTDLMHEYALGPRPLWFGPRRIAPGQPIEVSGDLLSMLVAGKATGSLTITLEDMEPVHGHPCGRFAIKGSYQRKQFPLVDGRRFDEQCTIQSGQIWLSVVHPLVLRHRLERIVTFSITEGGPTLRYQGSASSERTIAWNVGGNGG